MRYNIYVNWVDLVIIIVLIFFAFEGLGRSLISEIFDLLSFIFAFLVSIMFYNLAAHQLELLFSLPHSLANVLGFIATWFVTETVLLSLVNLVFRKISRLDKIPASSILSMIPSTLKGLAFVAVLLVLVGTFPVQPKIKKDINDSKIGSVILNKTYQLETPLKGIFGGLANDTLTFLTVHPKTNERLGLGFQTDDFSFDEKVELKMVELVNKERITRGFEALLFDSNLRAVARVQSADMFKRGYFSHYSPEGKNVADRANEAGVSYLVIGENLAFAPTLELAHHGLVNSPGHRANILSSDFKKIGIGVASSTSFGMMFTQVFSN